MSRRRANPAISAATKRPSAKAGGARPEVPGREILRTSPLTISTKLHFRYREFQEVQPSPFMTSRKSVKKLRTNRSFEGCAARLTAGCVDIDPCSPCLHD